MTPWGFDPGSIEGPVVVVYGDQDEMVPEQHGDWLASRLPHAVVLRELGHGHMSRMSEPAWLLDRLLGAL
jgi:pimeloyl-ACP methyl ester carboxylesterase